MKKLFLYLALLLLSVQCFGFEAFVIKDIKLEGLQRISAGTVFNYLPVKVGDKFTSDLSARAIRSLYQTGFFKDVRLEREQNILVVFVAEKPAIANIKIEGNSDIPDDKLKEVLKQVGLSEGRVFDRSVLETIQLELQRQYYSLGKYAMKVETEVRPLERNRVEVEINIAEGEEAEVYSLNIVGNKVFSDEKLHQQLELGDVSLFGGRDNYSKQVLAADIEILKSYYLDRGYINFTVNSSQVSITPDKQDVYITLNVTEGDKFIVHDTKLAGDLILPEDEIYSLVQIKAGDVFSRNQVSETRKNISERLAEEGYAFANVNIVPEIDNASKTVELTVYVDPGKRVYVRRINVSGNLKTKDEVIRRELRQMEGSKMSTKLIAQSRTRLNRLGFFETVDVETPKVAGVNDQVDVNYTVKERPTGTLSAGIGYSDQSGAIFNFSVTQENFVGTGNRIGVNLSNSDVVDEYRISYKNPYYTDDGISRGFSLYSRKVDAGQTEDISNYVENSYGVSMNFGIPLSEQQFANFGVSYQNTELLLGTAPAQELTDFTGQYGSVYDTYRLEFGWRHDSRNKAIFADSGNLVSFGTEYAVPGGDLEFYKLNLRYLQYLPLWGDSTFSFNTELGYGDGLGDTESLPFFENYYAGGSRSVRGYRSGTLGPKDSVGNSLGGSSRFIGNMELILPNPFSEQNNSTRVSLFLDAGYAYGADEPLSTSQLRYSAGMSLIWLTPVGAMRFSLANALNEEPDDQTQQFQFTLGSAF